MQLGPQDEEHGARGATLAQRVIFHEEYARSGAPAQVGYLGEELLGPTLIAFGTPEQQRRFLLAGRVPAGRMAAERVAAGRAPRCRC